jgi:hypothetical protein
MTRIRWLIFFVGLATPALAQLDAASIPPEQDQRDLYARAATSRLAIIGKVIQSEGRSKRIPPEALAEQVKKGSTLGGSLITVQVEEIVCRQSDFDDTAPKVDNRPQPFYLFVPFDAQDLANGHFREEILPGRRYLLLLTELDAGLLSSKYQVDPDRIYYRGQEANRGVIPLEPETRPNQPHTQPEVVGRFRKLCAAMRPPKPDYKVALLQQLAHSGDPVLQKEAENAISAVKAKMVPEQPPKAQPR